MNACEPLLLPPARGCTAAPPLSPAMRALRSRTAWVVRTCDALRAAGRGATVGGGLAASLLALSAERACARSSAVSSDGEARSSSAFDAARRRWHVERGREPCAAAAAWRGRDWLPARRRHARRAFCACARAAHVSGLMTLSALGSLAHRAAAQSSPEPAPERPAMPAALLGLDVPFAASSRATRAATAAAGVASGAGHAPRSRGSARALGPPPFVLGSFTLLPSTL